MLKLLKIAENLHGFPKVPLIYDHDCRLKSKSPQLLEPVILMIIKNFLEGIGNRVKVFFNR